MNNTNAATSTEEHSRLSRLLIGFFFFSGLSSLIYEILWVRMLTRIVGGSDFSVGIVLTIFMGGLALGSLLAAKFVHRIKNTNSLAVLYGILELIIGFYALLFPFILTTLKPVFAALYNHFCMGLMTYNIATSGLCALLLIIPTTLMGASLPVLAAFYVTCKADIGAQSGRLYAANTIGGAAGAFLCGFILIQWLGVQGTLFTAVAINLLIAGSCVAVFAGNGGWLGLFDLRVAGPPIQTSSSSTPNYGLLLVFAVSGFCAMACEVIWTKLLGLLVGPTTYSFTIILVAFITGLALGSVIFGRLADRTNRPLMLLVTTQIAAAVLVLVISQILGNSQLIFAKLLYAFRNQYALMEIVKALGLIVLILPPTLCFGGAFPLVVKLYAQDMTQVGRAVGFANTINTIGALMGSFAAGFILIPCLGKETSLAAVAGLQVVTVLAFYLRRTAGETSSWKFLPVAAAAAVLALTCLIPSWDRLSLATGKYQRFDVRQAAQQDQDTSLLRMLLRTNKNQSRAPHDQQLLYYGDGIGGFTTVVKFTDPMGNTTISMANNGKVDASTKGDMSTQVLSAHIPLLFHRNPKKVMILGMASGITAGEALHYPIEQLDILEISPQVVEASRHFANWNNHVLSDPRTRLMIQDGRTHIELTSEKYDVISSEPSNPWMAGLANLYTVDFFRSVREKLNPDGVFVQFIHSYQMDWASFSMVGRTLCEVFPTGLLVETVPGNDFLFLGFKNDRILDPETARRNIASAAKSTNMRIVAPEVIYTMIRCTNLKSLFGTGPLHTDRHPSLEFSAPRKVFRDGSDIIAAIQARGRIEEAHIESQLEEFRGVNVDNQLMLADFFTSLNGTPARADVNLERANDMQKARYEQIMRRFFEQNAYIDYEKLPAYERAICLDVHGRKLSARLSELSHLPYDGLQVAASYAQLGSVLLSGGNAKAAAACFQTGLTHKQDDPDMLYNLGICYELSEQEQAAIGVFQKLNTMKSHSTDTLFHLSYNYHVSGQTDKALVSLHTAEQMDPTNFQTLRLLSFIYKSQGNISKSSEYAQRAQDAMAKKPASTP